MSEHERERRGQARTSPCIEMLISVLVVDQLQQLR